MHRMRLHDLQLRLTLGAVQDLAFLYFVFVHVNLDGAFWTTNHGQPSEPKNGASSEPAYYITRGCQQGDIRRLCPVVNTPSFPWWGWEAWLSTKKEFCWGAARRNLPAANGPFRA